MPPGTFLFPLLNGASLRTKKTAFKRIKTRVIWVPGHIVNIYSAYLRHWVAVCNLSSWFIMITNKYSTSSIRRSWSPDPSAKSLRWDLLWFLVDLKFTLITVPHELNMFIASMTWLLLRLSTTLYHPSSWKSTPPCAPNMLRCRLRCLHDSRNGVHRHQRCWAKQMRNLPPIQNE